MDKKTLRWLLQSTIGLTLTGGGLALSIDAGFHKFNAEPWVVYGTVALVVFNSGLCIVIDAGLQKIKALKSN